MMCEALPIKLGYHVCGGRGRAVRLQPSIVKTKVAELEAM
jgi:hypothetical protein